MQAILLGGGLLVSGMAAAEPTVLSIGIVPQTSATELVKHWAPVLGYLSEKTGCRLRFETAKDIPTFERRLADGVYDLAYMSPFGRTGCAVACNISPLPSACMNAATPRSSVFQSFANAISPVQCAGLPATTGIGPSRDRTT